MQSLEAWITEPEEPHNESCVAEISAADDVHLSRGARPKDLLSALLDQSGQDLIEYALLIALVALSVTAGVRSVASKISTAYSNIGTTFVGYSGSGSSGSSGNNGNGAGNGQGNNGNNSGKGNTGDNGNGTGNGNNGNGKG